MAKTVSIHDDTHILIIKKQTEIFEKHKLNLRISDIIGIIMEKHIDELENDLENGIIYQVSTGSIIYMAKKMYKL